MYRGVLRRPFFLLVVILIVSWFFVAGTALAAECGKIVASSYFFNPGWGDETVVEENITNCLNPFNEDEIPPSPYTLKVEGSEVVLGEVVTIPVGGTNDIVVEGVSYNETKSEFLFLHSGTDFVLVDRSAQSITLDQYKEYVSVFGIGGGDTLLYQDIVTAYFETGDVVDYFYDEEGVAKLDEAGFVIESRFFGFLESADVALAPAVPKLRAGTYTMVIKESELLLGTNSWWQNLQELFIKTAYAEEVSPSLTYTITFTLIEGVVASTPSVLFLPGIMGSRLFEESSECNLFGGVDKIERWVSIDDCYVERLIMDENGQSVYPLFTEAEGGVVEDIGYLSNLYDSFFEDLDSWKEEGVIADYRGVPYDWRLRLEDILKAKNIDGKIIFDGSGTYQDGYVYQSLEALSETAPGGGVVLVGHSNGGMVIKTLLATMKANNDPLLDSIKKVVLVAVPQAGTPESVVGMLHGVDIGIAGIAISEEQSRQLINTAPFGYHLLPSAEYFEMVDIPVITIEAGTTTNPWRGQFGAEIDTQIELKYFLEKGSGRTTPAWDDLLTPATAYGELLHYANTAHSFVSDWKPAMTLVYEVAGTGISTPATINYFSDFTCLRSEKGTGGVTHCLEYGTKLGYRVSKVLDGDGTVVVPSALAVPQADGSEKWFVNLFEHNDEETDRMHKNIFEVQDVIDLVLDIVSGGNRGDYNFISKTEPAFEGKSRLVYQLHSPLDLYVILHDGEVVGSTTPIIRGVEYSRYGEVQQLSIPEDETGYEIRMSGLATGSFTLDIDSYEGDNLLERETYSAIPSSTSTQVSLKLEDDEVVIEIDYQGDGDFEATILPGLAIITPATPIVLETKSSSSGTRIGVRGLPDARIGELTGGEMVVTTHYELLLRLVAILTQYRDLLIKLKVQ